MGKILAEKKCIQSVFKIENLIFLDALKVGGRKSIFQSDMADLCWSTNPKSCLYSPSSKINDEKDTNG